MITLFDSVFICSFFALIYVYFLYPLCVAFLGKVFKRDVKKKDITHRVTVLIAAYNEEDHIGETIKNKLEMNYPSDRLEIIVISDGSTDNTDAIVRSFHDLRVKLLRQDPRGGKTSALNMAVSHAKGDVLVFSDANSIYAPDTLKYLTQNFNDSQVGYVTGKMIYTNPDGNVIGDGCSAYMKYENLLRLLETNINSVVGVDGGVDAMRKELYQPMRADQLPDFIQPLKVVEQGYRVVYESKAILKEQALKHSQEEYKMRVRVSLRSLWALKNMKSLFNPLKYGIFSWQLFSHKLLRYMAIIFLLSLYFSNLVLLWLDQKTILVLFFIGHNLFYLFAYLGYLGEKNGYNLKLFYIPYYFTLINIAAGHAFVKFLRGEKQIIWNPRTG